MQLGRRHAFDQLADARIGRDMRSPAAPDEHFAKRQRGEKVAAGAAGDEERPPSAKPPGLSSQQAPTGAARSSRARRRSGATEPAGSPS